MSLDNYLEYSGKKYADTYFYLYNVFEGAKWLSLPNHVIKRLEELDLEDDEYANFLLSIKSKSLDLLKNWKNIKNLEDIKNLKKMLQEEYLNNENLEKFRKKYILSSLAKGYIDSEDEEFFKKVLNNMFLEENIYFIKDIVRYIYSAMSYIKNMNNFKDEFIVMKNIDNETIKILYNGNSLYDNICTSISSLKIIEYCVDTQIIFLDRYVLVNPLFSLFSEQEVENKIMFCIVENKIDLKLLIKNILILETRDFDYEELAKIILKILKEYRQREQNFFNGNYKHSDYEVKLKHASNDIALKMLWSKKHNNYYLNIGNNKTKFNVLELLNLFQQVFFFLALQNMIANKTCLKNELSLSNKDFFRLTGLK